MANVALTDAIMMLISGVVCGFTIFNEEKRLQAALLPSKMIVFNKIGNTHKDYTNINSLKLNQSNYSVSKFGFDTLEISSTWNRSSRNFIKINIIFRNNDKMDEANLHEEWNINSQHKTEDSSFTLFLKSAISFFGIASWMSGVCSYAFLGINRSNFLIKLIIKVSLFLL